MVTIPVIKPSLGGENPISSVPALKGLEVNGQETAACVFTSTCTPNPLDNLVGLFVKSTIINIIVITQQYKFLEQYLLFRFVKTS